MQRRKLLIGCIALLIGTLSLTSTVIPRVAALTPVLSLSGLGVNRFSDPLTGATVDGIGTGATLTITAELLAPTTPAIQHNVTVGFKGDWMSSYTNASNAGPGSTLALSANQQAAVTVSITMPSTGGLTQHSWSVIVCDGPSNAKTANCTTTSNFAAGYDALAIYTSDQINAAEASVQATAAISNVNSALTLLTGSFVHTPPPGTTTAASQIAQANTEMALGGQSWRNGDFGGAKTHYQNALNDANAAAGSLSGQGGGVDEANLVNLILGGTGLALVGIGVLLAGFGAFMYFRRKPKA